MIPLSLSPPSHVFTRYMCTAQIGSFNYVCRQCCDFTPYMKAPSFENVLVLSSSVVCVCLHGRFRIGSG